jgi:predicted lipase
MGKSIEVHSGFACQQEKYISLFFLTTEKSFNPNLLSRTAKEILGSVQKALHDTGLKKVTIVGHSLGAALALLDGVYLPLHIKEKGVHFRVIGYGMPRVGNAAFANYVDHLQLGHNANLTIERINNK